MRRVRAEHLQRGDRLVDFDPVREVTRVEPINPNAKEFGWAIYNFTDRGDGEMCFMCKHEHVFTVETKKETDT